MKAAAAIRASLQRIFGSAVRVSYYDVSDPDVRQAHADTLTQLEDERLPLPAVLLDGHILFTGAVDPLRVVGAVAQAIQRSNVS